jgi:hypothetical protein
MTKLSFHQLHHRSRERFGFFLWKVVAGARDDAVAAAAGEFRRACPTST